MKKSEKLQEASQAMLLKAKHRKIDELSEIALIRIRWSREQLKRSMKPLVYIFWADAERTTALYVGQSGYGLARPLDSKHHRAEGRSQAFAAEFFICPTIEDAEALEKRLIRFLKPKLNIVGVPPTVAIVNGIEREMTRDSFYSK